MQLTPEMKAQLEEQKKQCVYCKILSKEMPGKILFENEKVMAILDIYPAIKGHVVYLPKEHYPLMAYMSGDEFRSYFGLVPELCKAIKEGMVSTGMNVFIAGGGVAGQMLPHLSTHFLPRNADDGFFNFMFENKGRDLKPEELNVLKDIFPKMMANHFARNPAGWHKGDGTIPDFLKGISETCEVLYEDEKALAVFAKKSVAPGHIEVYSKAEESSVDKLSEEDSFHIFSTASLAATLAFENLKAHGTNIIVKSGNADDNPRGKLCFHIIPRWQDDGLQNMVWQPKQPGYNLDPFEKSIKDQMWKVGLKKKKVETTVMKSPEVLKLGGTARTGKKKYKNAEEEIKEAIERASK